MTNIRRCSLRRIFGICRGTGSKTRTNTIVSGGPGDERSATCKSLILWSCGCAMATSYQIPARSTERQLWRFKDIPVSALSVDRSTRNDYVYTVFGPCTTTDSRYSSWYPTTKFDMTRQMIMEQ